MRPSEYEYLWTDYDVDMIFVSCYLFKRFRKHDFVLINDAKKGGVDFFLAKKEFKRLGEIGKRVYGQSFGSWERELESKISSAKKIMASVNKVHVREMPLRGLGRGFMSLVNAFQSLGDSYFYTEFFVVGGVESSPMKDALIVQKNMQKIGHLKMEARKVLTQLYDHSRFFKVYIDEISKRTGRKDLRWLTFTDIDKLVRGKKVGLSKLEGTPWFISKRTQWNVKTGREARAVAKSFEKVFNVGSDALFGHVARTGKYCGKVRVLRTVFGSRSREADLFKKGEVLVANTTGPEMMAACFKAGAIVTDEGGLISHAAVVSREIGIPCIVGTKRATVSFRTGDIVEVDADRGIVRKVKKQ